MRATLTAVTCAVFALHATLAAGAAEAETALAIEHCDLFDPAAGQMLADRTILVRGRRIAAVVAAGEPVDVPAGAIRVDGRGKFALPGFIDAHVHLVHVLDLAHVSGDEVLPLYLAAGVTSVRSTGDELVAARLVARHAAANPRTCPRVFTCTPLLDGDPPIHANSGRAVADAAQVARLLDESKEWNVATVKIYAGTPRAIGRTIIDEGHRRGLFVTGHLGRYAAQDAIADGIDCLEHISSAPADDATIAELARRKIYVDPTLVVFRNMIYLCDLPEVRQSTDDAHVPGRLARFWPRYLQQTGCPQGGTLEERRRTFAAYQERAGKLYRAGVPLLVGTDAPEPHVAPGASFHQELELLVEAGIPPAAALAAGTLSGAKVLGQADHLGSIAPGKFADLVLLSANPLEAIGNTRKIDLIVRDGHVCRPAELLKLAPKD